MVPETDERTAGSRPAVEAAPRTVRQSSPFGIRLRCAREGVLHALRTQNSLRTQLLFAAGALVVLIVSRPAAEWWAMVALASAAVLAAELLNTAIEQLADAVHPDHSESIRIVKDCAAGGVLVASLGAFGVGVALAVHLVLARA